jgi:FkbM family methyltransferase
MSAIVTSSAFGMALVPPNDTYLGQAFIRTGGYGWIEYEAWKPFLKEDSVVLDIGANFGSHTFHFATTCYKGAVYAFEPQVQLFYMLCGSIALQNKKNIMPYLMAVGETHGTIEVPEFDYRAPNNFGGVGLKDGMPGTKVNVTTIDGFRFPKVDFIKIDVEGMEIDVLKGAVETIKQCLPVISVEADRPDKTAEVWHFLESLGYDVYWHYPPLGEIWPGVCSCNFLAVPPGTDMPSLPFVSKERATVIESQEVSISI